MSSSNERHPPRSGYSKRIVVVGKSGTGKSALCNSIFRETKFTSDRCAKAVTLKCQAATSSDSSIILVDTPGLCDAVNKNVASGGIEIQRSLELCTNPHAFLLVFDSRCRFCLDDMQVIELLQLIFGNNVFKHTIVVFTNGDGLGSQEDLETFYEGVDDLKSLVEACGKRVCAIENKANNAVKDESIFSILSMIDNISNYGKRCFNFGLREIYKENLEMQYKKYNESDNVKTQLQEMNRNLEKKLRKQNLIRKTKLVGGAVVFVTGAAVSTCVPVLAPVAIAIKLGICLAAGGVSVVGGAVTVKNMAKKDE